MTTVMNYSDGTTKTVKVKVEGYKLDNKNVKYIYDVEVPTKLLEGKNDMTMIVTLQGVVKQGGGTVIKNAYDKVTFVKRELFNLD